MNSVPSSLIPVDDAARLQALERYQLLDDRSEKVLDEVVAATARLFRVSNALLSIVEKDEVLIKAPYNMPVVIERIPRAQSLCSATILREGTSVFEDLSRASAPGVDISLVQQLGLNFYAGHGLRTSDGYNIGSLCLYNGAPRLFTPAECSLLGTLAGLIMYLLELRRILGAHADSTAGLWDSLYKAIGGQLAQLNALVERTATTSATEPLSAPIVEEAEAIVAVINQFVTAALRRI